MPELQRLNLSGASKGEVCGFRVEVRIEFGLSGASKVRLFDFTVSNANINLSGASNASINDAGRLDAILSGASELNYPGNLTLGRMQTSGGSGISGNDVES